ncbi:hypothetical protein ACFFGT_12995 [Mucilaginibacter angelicae]|uniref:PLAT domain-containing protein n=1 Tax=Mucilaginibacter angelicae TaxID=869718 RepID=A0ABV6L6P9_9SPHI
MKNYLKLQLASVTTAAIAMILLPSFSLKKDEPILLKVIFVTHTNNDDKDHDTCIFVDVKTADGQTQIAHVSNADCGPSDGTQYKDDSDHQFELQCDGVGMAKSACKHFVVNIHQETHGGAGHDTWKFNAKVILQFSDHTNMVAEKGGITLVNNNASAPEFSAP